MTKNQRPLSPHLQIYKPQLTSILSILHRMTGMALTIGGFGLVLWLFLLAQGGPYFSFIETLLEYTFFQFCLTGVAFCFFYHLFNGIRHLFWDAGYGYELKTIYKSGWAVVSLSLGLTLLIWVIKG